ncbi:MAG: GNAT family N-acetyltransferase [Mesorhizobium amorphae]|nr:MAG: GNAT family N-acetyltransferase [Mesorhizobium amorphae]
MFVRSAGERDLRAVRALLVETWHATYDGIYGRERVTEITDEWHSVRSLEARLKRPRAEFLVADDGARIGGMAYAAATTDPNIVTLHQLYVLPAFQRRGVGSDLLAEIEECFPDARTLRVEVESQNSNALCFYRARGFTDTGEELAPGGTGFVIPALTLSKPLA